MRIGSSTTFADLRDGPVVLVGGFNNGWTMRVLSQLRYGFNRDPMTRVEWIEDRQNPSAARLERRISTAPYLKLTEDLRRYLALMDFAGPRSIPPWSLDRG